MARSYLLCAALALLWTSTEAYVAVARPAVRHRVAQPSMILPEALSADLLSTATLLAEIIDETGERIYGAVDAPGWVAPVGGVTVILTALLPVLLAPGEQAFSRQQGDEAKVSKQGRGRRFGNTRR